MDYEAVIGLEVHVQVKSRSKMFCGCKNEFGAPPNTHTCPVCLGMPGVLPVPNEEAIRKTILAGLLLGCDITRTSKFDRKSYFYPDMPKNYQISQYDLPLCVGGGVELRKFAFPKDVQKEPQAEARKTVRLVRIHLEEDVAKSTHFEAASGIDFNRAGTPLMEIVSEADLRTPEEAFAYLTTLQQVMIHGGISDADMEKGQLRCDVNVSVRPKGSEKFGTKIEIKNLNSISGVRRALIFEIARQIELVSKGVELHQETRRWDDPAGETYLMRTKESASDYRYFPDPDLMPLQISDEQIEAIKAGMAELPSQREDRFMREMGLTDYDASVLAAERDRATFFEAAAQGAANCKTVANLIINDLLSAVGAAGVTLAEAKVSPEGIRELAGLLDSGKINSKQGKEVFAEMLATGKKAAEVVAEKGLEQISDPARLEAIAREAVAADPKSAEAYRGGKTGAINKLKGMAMKISGGKANPQAMGEMLEKVLAS
jgi:aspartyl-tRNA(Asn)/glutamyl-tRNA(Gln) amidotransferase subunit B